MKLTKAKLLEIVEEELQEIIRKSGDEFCLYSKKKNPKTGKKRNLGCYPSRRTAEIAAMIQGMISDDTNLEEWVESKITKAQDYLSSVLNYMRGESLSEDEEK